MNSQLSLPLFPLNTVLFPGQVLPLHVFEPRYRQMIATCIEKGAPFGVALIQDGEEVDGPAKPYEVGTTARITQVERLDDGRFNIISVGELRFRINAVRQTSDGYLRADVTLWPWLPSDENAARTLVTSVLGRLRRYMELLSQAAGVSLDVASDDLPQQAAALACLTAIALQVEPVEKQDLLTSPSIELMLSKEVGLLQREARVLQVMLGSRGRPTQPDDAIVFSAN
jgi:Lon protease-like protein